MAVVVTLFPLLSILIIFPNASVRVDLWQVALQWPDGRNILFLTRVGLCLSFAALERLLIMGMIRRFLCRLDREEGNAELAGGASPGFTFSRVVRLWFAHVQRQITAGGSDCDAGLTEWVGTATNVTGRRLSCAGALCVARLHLYRRIALACDHLSPSPDVDEGVVSAVGATALPRVAIRLADACRGEDVATSLTREGGVFIRPAPTGRRVGASQLMGEQPSRQIGKAGWAERGPGKAKRQAGRGEWKTGLRAPRQAYGTVHWRVQRWSSVFTAAVSLAVSDVSSSSSVVVTDALPEAAVTKPATFEEP